MTKVWYSGQWVDVGGGGASLSDQYPAPATDDMVDSATSARVSAPLVAADAVTPHTPGIWVEVDPALAEDVGRIDLITRSVVSVSAANSATLMDIGVGAPGEEEVWATIPLGYMDSGVSMTIAGFLAAGTRVSYRAQSVILGKSIVMQFVFYRPRSVLPGAPIMYGIDSAQSRGTTIATANAFVKSAWTELVDVTAVDLSVVCVRPGGSGDTAHVSAHGLIDIGVGSPGEEVVIIPDIGIQHTTAEAISIRGMSGTYGVDIPAGSRIAARWARGSTGNALDLALIATPQAA
jgi:hypothetical protein